MSRSRTRTELTCLSSSIADLHFGLGQMLAVGGRIVRPSGGRPWDANERHFDGLAIEKVPAVRSMPEAVAHLASLSPERRKELEGEWE